MKKLLLTAAATLLTVAAFGQGQVLFSNSSSTAGWPDPAFNRLVHYGPTAAQYNPALVAGALVASNYAGVNLSSLRAVLYYGSSTATDLSLFTQASGGSASFKASTSATAGSWFPGSRTLDTAPNGTTVNLEIVVWDNSLSTDPLSAAARAGLWGASAPFQYTPPTSPTPAPSESLMLGLTAFNIGIIPEPATFALAGLGAAALLIFRRRK